MSLLAPIKPLVAGVKRGALFGMRKSAVNTSYSLWKPKAMSAFKHAGGIEYLTPQGRRLDWK